MCPRHSPRYMNINDQTRFIVSGVFVRHFPCFPKPHMKAKEFIKYEIAMHATIYHMMNEQLLIMRMRIATSREKKTHHLDLQYDELLLCVAFTRCASNWATDSFLLPHRIAFFFSFVLFCFCVLFRNVNLEADNMGDEQRAKKRRSFKLTKESRKFYSE